MRNTKPFYMDIHQVHYGLSEEQVHRFVDEFTTRYSKQLNEGRDLRFCYEFELSCLETGLVHFYLGQTYVNEDGETMSIIDRREDMLVIQYGDDYYGCDYWHEDGVEYCVMDEITWSAADIQPNEN